MPVLEANAQSTFEPGYVVPRGDGASADTVRGEIANKDWVRNPNSITFRAAANEPTTSYSATDLSAFGVGGDQYESYEVTIDQRPTEMKEGRPENLFERKRVFLLKLVDGTLTLFSYRDTNRKHFFLQEENASPKELTYYVQRVNRDGRYFRAESADYQYQLERAKTQACVDREVDRVDYTLRDLVKFVSACNGESDSSMAENALRREGFQFDHLVGVRLGQTAMKHSFAVIDQTTAGFSQGISYRFMASKRTDNPNYSLLIGLSASRVGEDETTVTELVSERTFPETNQTRTETRTETLRARATVGTFSIGARRRFLSGSIRPYLDVGLTAAYPLSYTSSKEFETTVALFPTGSPSEGNRATGSDSFDAAHPWTSPQFGLRGALGLKVSNWRMHIEYARALKRDYGGTVRDRLPADRSGFAPETRRIFLEVAYGF